MLSFVVPARLELGILWAVWLEAYGVEAVSAGSGMEPELDASFSCLASSARAVRSFVMACPAVGAWDVYGLFVLRRMV